MNENSRALEYVIEYGKKQIVFSTKLTIEGFLVALITLSFEPQTNSDIGDEIQEGVRLLQEKQINLVSFVSWLNDKLRKNELSVDMRSVIREAERGTDIFKSKITIPQIIHTLFKSRSIVDKYKTQKNMNTFASLHGLLKEIRVSDSEMNIEDVEREIEYNREDLVSLIKEVKGVREELLDKVIGQNHAIETFTNGYFFARLFSDKGFEPKPPKATFLFAGPPGVGKTYLASSVAKALARPFKRFDMSEYAYEEAPLEFQGGDRAFKNSKTGNVTSYVYENPRAVLLFDEIEKASLPIIHLFLQILDTGYLRDSYMNEAIPFKDNIIIFTTNAGEQLYADTEMKDFSQLSRKVILDALEKDKDRKGNPFFPKAICSRFATGNVVMFNHISAGDLYEITKKQVQRKATDIQNRYGIEFYVEPKVYAALVLAEGGTADARVITSRAGAFLDGEFRQFLANLMDANQDLKLKRLDVEMEQPLPDDIEELFEPKEQPSVLVVASSQECKNLAKQTTEIQLVEGINIEQIEKILKTQTISCVAIDLHFQKKNADNCMNIEDIDSEGNEIMYYLMEEHPELSIAILENVDDTLTAEECVSLANLGVLDIVKANQKNRVDVLKNLCDEVHKTRSMNSLAKSHKILKFKSAQELSEDNESGVIKLYDFTLDKAIEAEDSKDVLDSISMPDVSLVDVIGAEDAKQELSYFIDYLRKPELYKNSGVRSPKGVLLYGPPGTGKTMLAKAVANEAGVTFLSTEGNRFINHQYGAGAESIHRLFRIARKYAPAVLFIDEIDTIGSNRAFGGVDTSVLTALFTEMDGFKEHANKPVFVLAATNYGIDVQQAMSLDPALIRRFDRSIYIDFPGKDERLEFLKRRVAQSPVFQVAEDELDNLASRMVGMNLAQAEGVVELALRRRIRNGQSNISAINLTECLEIYNNGEARKVDMAQLRRTAIHEAGHAVLAIQCGMIPEYLTIVSRGNYGGYMQRPVDENQLNFTKKELIQDIRMRLGGRAAEVVCFGMEEGLSTGASSDLQSATKLAKDIVCLYGMCDEIGIATIENSGMNKEICDVVNGILREELEHTIKILQDNREQLDKIVDALLVKNHLNKAEIKQIVE